jgi:ankyrin repeat protein
MKYLSIALCLAMSMASGGVAAADEPAIVGAARAGDLASIQSLLAAGTPADTPDENRCTALNWAAYEGHLAIATALIEKGATIDSRCNKAGWTPLMNAAAKGHLEIAALLLDHGADINARSRDGGFTPLMYAARMTKKDVLVLLLDRGAAIDVLSDENRTALDFAEDADIATTLRARGTVAGVRR